MMEVYKNGEGFGFLVWVLEVNKGENVLKGEILAIKGSGYNFIGRYLYFGRDESMRVVFKEELPIYLGWGYVDRRVSQLICGDEGVIYPGGIILYGD